jgi:CBS domain-containing protein
MQGEERRDRRKVRQLHTVQPTTPLTTALSLLLDAGVSVLPIVDVVGGTVCMHPAQTWSENVQRWLPSHSKAVPSKQLLGNYFA